MITRCLTLWSLVTISCWAFIIPSLQRGKYSRGRWRTLFALSTSASNKSRKLKFRGKRKHVILEFHSPFEIFIKCHCQQINTFLIVKRLKLTSHELHIVHFLQAHSRFQLFPASGVSKNILSTLFGRTLFIPSLFFEVRFTNLKHLERGKSVCFDKTYSSVGVVGENAWQNGMRFSKFYLRII